MKCIYYLHDKGKSLFDKEHIIPKGLGTFGAHTPTLINKVCKECNGSLGKTIDNPLCRSGFAFDRHMKKVFKKTDDVSHHRHLPSTDLYIIEGKYKGHQVELSSNNSRKIVPKNNINFDLSLSLENEEEQI